jgi:hypothetical protein
MGASTRARSPRWQVVVVVSCGCGGGRRRSAQAQSRHSPPRQLQASPSLATTRRPPPPPPMPVMSRAGPMPVFFFGFERPGVFIGNAALDFTNPNPDSDTNPDLAAGVAARGRGSFLKSFPPRRQGGVYGCVTRTYRNSDQFPTEMPC